ncbi:MAG TPA: hypothetical protein VFU05_12525 [Cyclobacteriaceae bacterium]|nr:hypothetical protein [Cyclobacteriaceae bacterium]
MKKSLFILFLTISSSVMAQLNNRPFEQRMAVPEADSGKLFLGVNLLGFFKDNEYFDTTVEGYTLFGYQFNPYLSYHPAKNVRLDAGVYAQKDFGNDDYSKIQPTLSLKVTNNRNFNFIFGTLEGSVHHRLIEPLYDFERVLNNRLENGVQVLWMKDDLFLDAWIDWQNMIYLNDTEPERFTAGVSFNKTLFRNNGFHIDLPVQLVANHQGGQIDTVDNIVRTVYNGAAGLTFEGELNGFVRGWGLKSYVAGYRGDDLPYEDGFGFFINPYVTTKIGLTVMGSYWRGNEFLTVQGGDLYPSINEKYPTRVDEERDFLMLRFLYDVKIAEGLILTARAEPFYDTYAETLEYSFGLYLNFSDRFFLLNAKKGR